MRKMAALLMVLGLMLPVVATHADAAIKAFAISADVDTTVGDNTLIDVALYYVIVGDPGPTLANGRRVLWVRGLSPDSATLAQDIANALKTYLTNNDVTFGLLDTVHFEW